MIELKHSKPNKGFIVEEINDKLKKAGEVKPFEHPHVENDPKSASDHIDAVKKHVEKELKPTEKTAMSTKGEDRVVFAESMMFRNKGELAEFLTKLREQSIRRRVIPLHENKDGYRFEVRFERKPVLESSNGKPTLVDKDGNEVKVGDHVTSFRGEGATVTGMNPPTVPYKSGKVSVKWDNSESEMEYYVGVFNLGWKGLPWQDSNESVKKPNEPMKEAKGDTVHLDLPWEQFLLLKSAVAGAIKEALAKDDDARLDKFAELERNIDAQSGYGKSPAKPVGEAKKEVCPKCHKEVCECDKPKVKEEKHEDAPEWDFEEEDRLASESFAKEALEDDAVDTEPIKINESIEVPEKDMWDFGDEE